MNRCESLCMFGSRDPRRRRSEHRAPRWRPSARSVTAAVLAASMLLVWQGDTRAPVYAVDGGAMSRALSVAERSELWEPPVGRPLMVVDPFRPPPHPYGSGHRGIDIPAERGMHVLAPAGGTVSYAGVVVDRGVLSIRIDARTVLSMEPVDASVRAGELVQKAEEVGVVAGGAHCDDRCLHLGVRVDGEYVNPMRFLVERPVLLPW